MWLLQGVPREIEEVLRLEVEWLLVRIREEMKKVGTYQRGTLPTRQAISCKLTKNY